MAQRPIFTPQIEGSQLWREVLVTFEWFPGFAVSQMQKSIKSLHTAAGEKGIAPVLDISSKSTEALGVKLSAFNLKLERNRMTLTVEAAYQGSKVFEHGGPYTDLYAASSRDAKTDARIRQSGDLVAFDFMAERWPLNPSSAFYDWLYISALRCNPLLSDALLSYQGFSDIAFNPAKSWNCQARAAALYVSLHARGLVDEALSSQTTFIQMLTGKFSMGSSKDRSVETLQQQSLL
ncbi:MAG: hypothetical protein M3R24_31515 [Chloroflexota bacterium]|nr:hypothetical protein [Chloroflexota bacterium]